MMTLVTGASKGIGLALAHEFAKHGHNLVLVARDAEQLKSIAEELKSIYKVNVIFKVVDLSQEGSAQQLYLQLQAEGHQINCLVNNAGIGCLGSYAEMDYKQLHDLLHINMISLSELTRLYLADFVARNQGSVLQVASTAAFQPGPLMAAYYASKAYVVSLSHALAHELKGTKVRISILCPGPTSTHFMTTAKMEHTYLEKGYAGMMSPEVVANIAYKGLQKGKLFIIPGILNKIMVYAACLSPKGITAALTERFHRKAE